MTTPNLARFDRLASKWRKMSYSPMNLQWRLVYADLAGELETACHKYRKSAKKIRQCKRGKN